MTLSHEASALEEFIRNRMRMSHIYQPVMLKVLLEGSGTASLEDIAKALLSYDLPQIEYYGLRTKRMVGDVLTKNGIVEPIKSGKAIMGYRLVGHGLSEAQRESLSALCDAKLADFIERRGGSVWGEKHLFSRQNQATFTSVGRPLGECRIRSVKNDKILSSSNLQW